MDNIRGNTGLIIGLGTLRPESVGFNDAIKWFMSPFVSQAADPKEIANEDIYMSKGFIEEIERVKRDFQNNPNDFKKFPKVNDDAWK